MKFLSSIMFLFLSATFITKCEKNAPQIPGKYYDYTQHNFVSWNDTLFLYNARFSGYVYTLFENGRDTATLFSYWNGLPEGIQKRWYDPITLMECREYNQGKKNGKQLTYWENGNVRFEYYVADDVNEGEMKEWDIKGNLIHLGHYKNGQEEGVQKMWYPDGKIRLSYIVKNGERYDLPGTPNTENASDSPDLYDPGNNGLPSGN